MAILRSESPTPGASGAFQTHDNVSQIPPPPNEECFPMIFGFLVVGLRFSPELRPRC